MNFMQTSLWETLQAFHFIRPYFLWMLLPAVLFVLLLVRREKISNAWQRHIDPLLLAPLLRGSINRSGKKLPLLSLLFWIVCALALAGPTWEKLPTPIEKRDTALVILMDLSPSMLAADVKPSRLIAARHKVLDLLQARKEGYSALIAYSGDAHIVSPLTDDTQTIASLLNVLEPGIMPVYGSNLEDALKLALQLFQNGGYTQGDILLVTDGITTETLENSAALLKGKSFTLSVIGVGTEEGGPIPDSNGGFVKNKQGTIILPQLHAEQLMALAKKVNGYYSPLQLNDSDIQPLIEGTEFFNRNSLNKSKTKNQERTFDQWRDVGGAVSLLLLPLLLAGFRRGVLISLMMTISLWQMPKAYAAESSTPASSGWSFPSWNNLWLNDNQRAMKAMQDKAFESAAKQFSDPNWKASAQYEQGDYASALKQFKNDFSVKGMYNQGNALAKSGQLQEAINAYNQALKQNPQFSDAAFNKKIVEDLLKQQQKQPQDKNQQDKSGDQSKKEQNDKGQQSDKNGDQQQNKSGEQKDSDSKTDQQKNEESQEQKKAQQDNENRNNQEAQTKPGEKGKDQTDQNAANKPDEKKMDNKQNPLDQKDKQTGAESKLTPEQKQALEQWLRQVPDDPSGLLRNKFEYYYQQRLQEQQQGKAPKHTNDEERW